MRKILMAFVIVVAAAAMMFGTAFAAKGGNNKQCDKGKAADHNKNCAPAAPTCGPLSQALIDADNGLEQIGQPICDLTGGQL